eukprot:1160760-Pelagomonas_calceolata.AAC.10
MGKYRCTRIHASACIRHTPTHSPTHPNTPTHFIYAELAKSTRAPESAARPPSLAWTPPRGTCPAGAGAAATWPCSPNTPSAQAWLGPSLVLAGSTHAGVAHTGYPHCCRCHWRHYCRCCKFCCCPCSAPASVGAMPGPTPPPPQPDPPTPAPTPPTPLPHPHSLPPLRHSSCARGSLPPGRHALGKPLHAPLLPLACGRPQGLGIIAGAAVGRGGSWRARGPGAHRALVHQPGNRGCESTQTQKVRGLRSGGWGEGNFQRAACT